MELVPFLATVLGSAAIGYTLGYALGYRSADIKKTSHYRAINDSYKQMITEYQNMADSEAGQAHNAGYSKGYIEGLTDAHQTIQSLLNEDTH
jgi:flagellar biosynthesis/type III secretory pathway protein FliH